jgi:hypothetical protein
MTRQLATKFDPPSQGIKVLVASEYSGIVRNAFLAQDHDASSSDLLPSEDGSNRHITRDPRQIMNDGWDLLMAAHPPCTGLCNSGVRWLSKPPPGRTLEDMQRELHQGAIYSRPSGTRPSNRIRNRVSSISRHLDYDTDHEIPQAVSDFAEAFVAAHTDTLPAFYVLDIAEDAQHGPVVIELNGIIASGRYEKNSFTQLLRDLA